MPQQAQLLRVNKAEFEQTFSSVSIGIKQLRDESSSRKGHVQQKVIKKFSLSVFWFWWKMLLPEQYFTRELINSPGQCFTIFLV
jgi:hypothetical protein